MKDAYPVQRMDESFSKLEDVKLFATLDLGSVFSKCQLLNRIERRLDILVNKCCLIGNECNLAYAMKYLPSRDSWHRH